MTRRAWPIVAMLAVPACTLIYGLDDRAPRGEGGASSPLGGGGAAACEPGEMVSCYDGPAGTEGVGRCQAGLRACDVAAPCVGQVLPATDACATPEDEDCDGTPANCTGEPVWVRQLGPGSPALARALTTFPDGSIAVAGRFRGALSIGNDMLMGPQQMANAWSPWVARFEGDGTPIWAKSFGNVAWIDITAMTADPTQLSLGGWFSGSLSIAPPAEPGALNDPFVAIISGDGTATEQTVWTGPTELDFITDIAPSGDGGLFVVGFAATGFTIGSTTVGANHASFVAHLASNGTVDWANVYQAPSLQSFESVAVQGDKLIVVGLISAPIDFGSGVVVGSADSAGGDPLVLTLSPADGSHLASVSFPGPGSEYARGVAFAPDGSYVVAMSFQQSFSIGGRDHVGQGAQDLLFVGFDVAGEVSWSRAVGGSGAEYLNKMAIGPSGNIHFVASYDAPFDLGTIAVPHVGSEDAVVAKLGPTGEALWAQALVGPQGDNLRALVADIDDSTLVAGWFSYSGATFGGSALGAGPVLIARLAP